MTDQPLSPAAQAVLDALEQDGKIIHGMPLLRPLIAAALRAAVQECAGLPDGRDCTELLRNIANELEGHQ